jgi:hypothetical protein
VEASQVRVFQSGIKTGGGAIADGARGIIAEVESSLSRRQTGRCNGLCQTLLPLLCHFHSVSPRGIVVI